MSSWVCSVVSGCFRKIVPQFSHGQARSLEHTPPSETRGCVHLAGRPFETAQLTTGEAPHIDCKASTCQLEICSGCSKKQPDHVVFSGFGNPQVTSSGNSRHKCSMRLIFTLMRHQYLGITHSWVTRLQCPFRSKFHATSHTKKAESSHKNVWGV